MPNLGRTTAPSPSDTESGSTLCAPDAWFFILAHSAASPERVGQCCEAQMYRTRYIGRGYDNDIQNSAAFGIQLPGAPPPLPSLDGFLDDLGVSGRQLTVRGTDDGVEIKQVGRCETYVNGVAQPAGFNALVGHGDTIMFKRQVVLLCVRRPRIIPALRFLHHIHPFGYADVGGIAGESYAAWMLREELAKAAITGRHILVLGESGTGKELASRLILALSDRAHAPFIDHDGTSFVDTLKESTLFGNLKGFPNAADPMRPGLVGAADGGFLFFDELGDCPPQIQKQLLRLLQQQRYTTLGASSARDVNLRFIGATNRDPNTLVGELFARLSTRIVLPPLRSRREDIPLILRQLVRVMVRDVPHLRQYCAVTASGDVMPRVHPKLIDYLVRHPLPYNARDIVAVIDKSIGVSPGDELRLPPMGDLPVSDRAPSTRPASIAPQSAAAAQAEDEESEEAKVERVRGLLVRKKGNVSAVAEALGMDRSTLRRFMKRHGLGTEETRP